MGTEDEMVGWHHGLNGHEFEQTMGDGEGQQSQACCSPWGCRVRHNLMTNNNNTSIENTESVMMLNSTYTSHRKLLTNNKTILFYSASYWYRKPGYSFKGLILKPLLYLKMVSSPFLEYWVTVISIAIESQVVI